MSRYVLDASAVWTFLEEEPGHEAVSAVLRETVLSAVNAAEVAGKLAERGATDDEVQMMLEAVGCPLVPFTEEHVRETGMLRPMTKSSGLSLGDRACLATAGLLGATAVTADPQWSKLRLPVKVRVVR